WGHRSHGWDSHLIIPDGTGLSWLSTSEDTRVTWTVSSPDSAVFIQREKWGGPIPPSGRGRGSTLLPSPVEESSAHGRGSSRADQGRTSWRRLCRSPCTPRAPRPAR